MSELTADETSRLKDLVQRSTLEGIQFHEVSARLTRADAGDPMNTSEDAEITFQYQTRVGEDDFGVRTQVDVESETGKATSVVAAEYKIESGEVPDGWLLDLFATEVGVMALFPYLRESISASTAKVFGKPVWLPILQRGQIRAGQEE